MTAIPISPTYDVIIIGYGPVSQLLALALARQGQFVAVVERWKTRFPLPRAVCIDHEIYRVLSACGLGPMLPSISHGGALYQWFNADWKELLVIDWTQESISGGTGVNFVHQPTLEESIDKKVTEYPNVELFLGWEARAIDQDERRGWADIVQTDTGESHRISGRYIVGCDGANSLVRETIGGDREDRGFEADWLVIDVLLKDGVTIEKLGIPASGQHCNPIQPTTIVPGGVREGRWFRRWEFMRLPGVTVEEMEREERVWELLKPWTGPDEVELVRHKVYNFRSLLAKKWRDKRLLIAGDAAHVMPPFLGQGMCSGMRDVWNLAWKLALILDGKANDCLLDSYQVERLPHISQLIDMSVYLGKIICIPDAEAAAARDRAFFEGTAEPFPPFPVLSAGLLRRSPDGHVQKGAGQLAPHVHIEQEGVSGRLDDILSPGFQLIVREGDVAEILPPAVYDAFTSVHVHIVPIGADIAGTVRDLDGKFVPFMEQWGWTAMIVRPDFYIYGGAETMEDIPELVDALLQDLQAAGVRIGVLAQTLPSQEYNL
jgi:2-polyprenyl-6-methoxyphenol hydroxylase-like FAD-dependent oxidoreductase